MKYNFQFFFLLQSLSVSRCHWWPSCRVAAIAAASSNGEACRQASSRLAELLKFIPLCILQYPPFFLPLPKQQASRHLGYFKFVPLKAPPTPLPPILTRANARTHYHRGCFKRKLIHVFLRKFYQSFRWRPVRGFRWKMKVVKKLSAMV